MLGVGKGIDIEELADGLKYRAGVLRGLLLEDELLLLYAEGVHRACDTGGKEGQLIGDICGVLIEDFEHAAVGKGAESVKQAVDNGDEEGNPALGIVPVGFVLPRAAKLGVLVGFREAEEEHAEADERDRDERHRGQIVTDADSRKGEHGDDGTGAVADRRGYRKLDIPQADIADGHRENVQYRDRQISQEDAPAYLNAADKNFIAGVQTHDNADCRDHFQVTVFIGLGLAAYFGEKIRAAPAEQGNDREGEPHRKITHLSIINISVWILPQYARFDNSQMTNYAPVP